MIEIYVHSQLYIANKLKAINDVITDAHMWYGRNDCSEMHLTHDAK